MSSLKPIGSEKLTGEDKLKRIMEIARFKESTPLNLNENSKSEYQVTLSDGNEYQIVREKSGYIIKKTISESTTDYIEPMKNRKYYSSYSQAFKRLNLLAKEINRITENTEEINLFGEQKKFVLKTPKPVEPEMDEPEAEPAQEPPAVPQAELPPSPLDSADGDMNDIEIPTMGDEMPSDTVDVETDTVDTEVEEPATTDVEDEMVSFKTIQKLTGKLTQKIRVLDNKDGMTSEDIKYVINMVLSALDLKNLTSEDKEDILSKFEDAESREEMPSDEDITSDTEVEKIQTDMDVPVEQGSDFQAGEEMKEDHGMILNNVYKESKIDKVLSKYFEFSKKEILETKEKNEQKNLMKKEEIKKIMKNVIKLTETIEQELSVKKFLEENSDFKLIGKTNKKNLVFENQDKQVKISPEGLVI